MRLRTLLFGFLLAIGTSASAQMPPGMGMPNLKYNPALLLNPVVQKDMHVSPEVSGKVMNVLMTEGMKMMGNRGGKPGSPGAGHHGMGDVMEVFNQMQTQILSLLTLSQKVRLHEITLQSFGATALLDPKVGAEVGLSATQNSKLQAAISSAGRKSQARIGSMPKGKTGDMSSMTAFAAKAAEAAKAAKLESDAALHSILTPTQMAKWKKLQGKHLELKGAMGMGGIFGM